MSFGQGGPPWGAGEGQNQQPWQGGDPHGQGPRGHDPYGGPTAFGDGSAPSGATPDWAALAEASAARTRRRRLLMIGGGALATVAIAGLVATGIVLSNDDAKGSERADGGPSGSSAPASTGPGPSFSSVAPLPPPDPNDFIADEKKDRAPLTLDGLFPGARITVNGRTYAEAAAHRTGSCAAAAQRALAGTLQGSGCDQMFRATYHKDGLAVTVGIAVFGTTPEARRAKETSRNIRPLAGKGVGNFCQGGPVCLVTSNQVGRYAYYTSTGYTSGKSVTSGDTKAYRLNNDVTDFVFRQIAARGTAQASAAAGAPG
ncbi:hypothetical protein [Streptomyces qinzhouensis]|uniref:Uncharacterized protein n=1 Tax=Streptomyces qinzhouensis TaxID=2599401 RepID=A0A5B8IJB3_9ACTN|nr:hypothetical protein [Streptomyces qinzhouensis]QDY78552.1 hypothetical protein FQU76_20860 [Streptomyces qinzhouensis]